MWLNLDPWSEDKFKGEQQKENLEKIRESAAHARHSR